MSNSKWTCDVTLEVQGESPEDAAQVVAALVALGNMAGAPIGGAVVIAVRRPVTEPKPKPAPERTPMADAFKSQLAAADAQAAFNRIMGAPDA